MNLTIWLSLAQVFFASSKEKQNTEKLSQLLNLLQKEVNYQTVLCVEDNSRKFPRFFSTDVLFSALHINAMPVLQLDFQRESKLAVNLNRNILVLVMLSPKSESAENQLTNLWTKLENMIQSNTILIFEEEATTIKVKSIFSYCVENKAMNVIGLSERTLQEQAYYGIHLFPNLKVELKSFGEASPVIFPNQVADMQGHPIRVVESEVSTKSYFYNFKGKRIYSGLMGRLITTYSEKHNATLSFPSIGKQNRAVYRVVSVSFIKNNSHDMMADVASYSLPNLTYSKVYDQSDWCLMVPVRSAVPKFLFPLMVYDSPIVLLMFLAYTLVVCAMKTSIPFLSFLELAINTFRGFLGQDCYMPKKLSPSYIFLGFVICFTGLIFNALYTGQIGSFATSPPTEPPLTTLTQFQNHGYKLVMYKDDLRLLPPDERQKISLKIINNYDDYLAIRDSFDRRYIFIISSWSYTKYEEQQKFFSKPLLKFGSICWSRHANLMFPLQQNSQYLKTLNTLIGQVHQAGLLLKWKRQCFWELLQMKRIKLLDLGVKHRFKSLSLEDFMLVFGFLIIASSLSIFCFLLEIYWINKIGRRQQNGRQIRLR